MSDRRQLANRNNASKSTGPRTDGGKAVTSKNAIRHGLRSNRILLDDEEPAEFVALQSELVDALLPIGSVEMALAERIVIAIWRQRRLAIAECAATALERRESEILSELQRLHEYSDRAEIDEDSLKPFDPEQAAWCQAVIDELSALVEINLETLKAVAPNIWTQFEKDAAEDQETPEDYATSLPHGVEGFVFELSRWCRSQLQAAERRPQLLALAQQLRDKQLILPSKQLDVLARYQTTLDNQLYKALRAFREAQEYRLQTIDGSANTDEVALAQAAA
jgi:hypothetical protein